MKKSVLLICLAVGVSMAGTLRAQAPQAPQAPRTAQATQGGDIERRVEVTREYAPSVEAARKIDFRPVMVDTVSLKPEISYSITPTRWNTTLGVEPISPVAVSTAEWRPTRPLFVRLGGGLPAQSIVDVYLTTPEPSPRAGLYMNHYGRWADIENDLGESVAATVARVLAGAYGTVRIGRRELRADVGYDFRTFAPYGAFTTERGAAYRPADEGNIAYRNLTGSVVFGDSFADSRRINFSVGLSGRFFRDRESLGENGFKATGRVGAPLGVGTILLDAAYVRWSGAGYSVTPSPRESTLSVTPRYEISAGSLDLSLGAELVQDNYTASAQSHDEFYVFPKVRIAYGLLAGLTPYASLDGGLAPAGYAALSYLNPYMIGELPARRQSVLGGKIGIYGAVGGVLDYDFSAGYDAWDNYTIFVHSPLGGTPGSAGGTRFAAVAASSLVGVVGVAATAGLQIARGLKLDAHARYNSINFDAARVRYGLGMPEFTAGAALKYEYRERLYLSAGLDFVGERQVGVMTSGAGGVGIAVGQNEMVPSSLNLKAGAEYKFGERLGVFFSADNLLGERIYIFSHYPSLGANVTAGVKMTF